MADTPLLEVRNASKAFGAVQALYRVDFEIRPGEVMALVGDNGAGKSTLIKGIAGIYPFDEGEIFFDGKPDDHPRARGTPPGEGSRSSTRISRSPTTSTSSRTCSSAASGRSELSSSTSRRWSGRRERRSTACRSRR